MSTNRRSFIRSTSLAAAGSLVGLRPFGALNAFAQTESPSTDYKALVCIFLFGGNDGNNMLVPFDPNGYSNYASLRGPLALPQNQLLQLASMPNFSLHGNLPEVRQLIDSGAAALVANVGTLIQPTTRDDVAALRNLPSNLFSHTDQQLQWQNASQSASTPTGWAGRMSDLLGGTFNSSASIPMITSMAGDTLFCDGRSSTPLAVSPGNIGNVSCGEGPDECPVRQAIAQSFLSFDSGISLVQADNTITQNAYRYASILAQAVSSVSPLATVFPANNPLATQLQQIAQLMQVRSSFGVNRQIFFASIGNFDTHSDQISQQGLLLGQLSTAMSAFYQATQELGIAKQVTTFTMSDFSRALQPNSNTGSDHGWGSNHIVLGGAVRGAKLYGTYPTLALGGTDDSGMNGRWIPSTGSVQYAATLASWFGVQASQLSSIFPNIGAFPSANLGFV
ncbi:DUF1501 domain-containing protein [Edaphobacter aggregans]|uniref:DUF1501 domain-containing protein n=1 Tax=Edaphobacter aggregans TaxID=570835 RepID=UPI00054F8110|nr:DUF1501 domain-containing protein [Edaphobacter aggregans]